MNELNKLLSEMTEDEKHFAWHFYIAVVEDGCGFTMPKDMRYRLRELGLMQWKGGNYFETTDLLHALMPMLNDWHSQVYPATLPIMARTSCDKCL